MDEEELKAQERAAKHQVLSWAHEGLALVEAGLVPSDLLKAELYSVVESNFSALAALESSVTGVSGEPGRDGK